MTTFNLIPPSSGVLNSISVNGRIYSSTPGVAIPVPDFDAEILLANGWMIQPTTPSTNSTTMTVTGGIYEAYYFQGIVNPPTPSTAIVPVLLGEANYPIGASTIGGGGHMIGSLGHLINNNITNTLPLGIGTEGKIDNYGTGTITAAISTDNNLGTNAGTIGTWYGSFSDIGSNTGTSTGAAAYGLNIDSNIGTIGSYIGYYFPTLSSPGTISVMYGYFFNNNPAITGPKFAVYCADAAAQILSLGPITTTGALTTATFHLDTGIKTAIAVGGAATLNKASGKITSEPLTTAAGASYTLTLTDSAIAAADTVFVSVANGTNTTGLRSSAS